MRSNSIRGKILWTEIEGIAENVCSDEDAVLKVAEVLLNVNVKREDVDICHRIKRKKSSAIIGPHSKIC